MKNRFREKNNFLFESRSYVLAGIFGVFAFILVGRLFYLQIVNGQDYQENYNLKLEKTESIVPTRGNIYDRNGKLLAYNELVYTITIEDIGKYSTVKEKNEKLNAQIADIIMNIELRGDSIDNNFGITMNDEGEYEFIPSGSSLRRFRADIFGHANVDELTFNEKAGIDEANCTAVEMINYMKSKYCYNVSDEYDEELAYKIIVIRNSISQNSYKKYIAATIASDISESSVAYIMENNDKFVGVSVEEQSMRRYTGSEYLAHIIGYTGQISTEEYEEILVNDETIEPNDVIGKSGIEKEMNEQLFGKKGYSTIFVDSRGTTIAEGDKLSPTAGNDVYISIDYNLQEATYNLIEQKIAGILYTKIVNIKEYKQTEDSSADDVLIPIYDVYNSLIANNIIDVYHFDDTDATETEVEVYEAYKNYKSETVSKLKEYLSSDNSIVYKDLPDNYQEICTYVVTTLKSLGIFDASAINAKDEMQQKWTSEELCVNDYLMYAIENNWIDITTYEKDIKYADTEELYKDLISYVIKYLDTNSSFRKMLYKHMIMSDLISGRQLSIILFDQRIIDYDDEDYSGLKSGSLQPYYFLKEKIKNLELNPGQLSLDPCSGSSVIIDTKTGELLACVSYPGYDNNKLANNVDSSYYSYLLQCGSSPLYNHATQQRTAPGSTFKPCVATAGLAENVITTSTIINDTGVFEYVNNHPKCWSYPRSHGPLTVDGAIKYSCNYFFYMVGYQLAGGSDGYNDAYGIERIQKYASLYGFDDVTGVEISESEPHIATEYPVMAAIGQSDNNYTTISLARYATALATKGNVYNLTVLDSVRTSDGDIVEQFSPSIRNHVSVLDDNQWNTIHRGMNDVISTLSSFTGFPIKVAGKTGTAQQIKNRPNHALFIGFAPFEDPEIAIATRIGFGYTSSNAADISKNIISFYYNVTEADMLINGQAQIDTTTTNVITD